MASKDSNDDDLKDKPDNSEDSFGLPDIEYKPLEPTSDTQVREEVTSSESSGYSETRTEKISNESSYDSDTLDEPKSKAPIILGIVMILMGGVWLLVFGGPLVGLVVAFGRWRGTPLYEFAIPAVGLVAGRGRRIMVN